MVVLHAHQPVQLITLLAVKLRLVQFSDVHTHGLYVAIVQGAVGSTNVATITGEMIPSGVDWFIVPYEVVELEPVGIPAVIEPPR